MTKWGDCFGICRVCNDSVSAQDPPPPPLLAPAAALLQRLAPYGLTVPQAWLQPRIVLLDVGAGTALPSFTQSCSQTYCNLLLKYIRIAGAGLLTVITPVSGLHLNLAAWQMGG